MIPTKRASRKERLGERSGLAEYVYLGGLAAVLTFAAVVVVIFWASAGDVSFSTALQALFD